MNAVHAFFSGKKITVMGLGVLGRGVGDVAFLARYAREIVVTDKKTQEALRDSISQLSAFSNISYHLGGHQEADFTQCDMVIKAAGVPLDSPYIATAKAVGVPVYMSSALFAMFAMQGGATVVGVTGTRGKSTITQMIYHSLILQNVRVFLGGNVRGISTLSQITEVQSGDTAVLELDSWQLQGFGDLGISPQVAVFSNLMNDHQNYYPNEALYFQDKANIFKNQKENDTLIVGNAIAARIRATNPPVTPTTPPAIPESWRLKIPGEHNRENAALAAGALRAQGLSEAKIQAGMESFTGVEGRLQLVKEANGVKIYNDNNATTPDATIAALRALSAGSKHIILIMGGADKGLDTSQLLYEVAYATKRLILLAGSGTEKITPFMSDYSIYDNLTDAVREAIRGAQTGDTILFSPAFASFGMFLNEYDRNDQFLEIIKKISTV